MQRPRSSSAHLDAHPGVLLVLGHERVGQERGQRFKRGQQTPRVDIRDHHCQNLLVLRSDNTESAYIYLDLFPAMPSPGQCPTSAVV